MTVTDVSSGSTIQQAPLTSEKDVRLCPASEAGDVDSPAPESDADDEAPRPKAVSLGPDFPRTGVYSFGLDSGPTTRAPSTASTEATGGAGDEKT